MRVVRVKEKWDVVFRAHDFRQVPLAHLSPKVSLPFRRADDYRNSDLDGGCDNCLEQRQIRNIEMT